jgi:hypothetical protein
MKKDEYEKQFRKIIPRSLAASVMTPSKIMTLSYPDQSGAYHSIALGAFRSGSLGRLDKLFEKFNIQEAKNKRRLEENWLNYVGGNEIKFRKSLGNVYSALSELLVADYVGSKCNIVHMDLLNGGSPDLSYEIGSQTTNAEIKYLDVLPAFQKLITRKIKGECVDALWIDKKRMATYIYSRIAVAAQQLSVYKSATAKEVWLVFAPSGEREDFERLFFKKMPKWYASARDWLVELYSNRVTERVDNEKVDEILNRAPDEWVEQLGSIVFATCRTTDWVLDGVKRY